MCANDVIPEAQQLLAEILRDLRVALCPEDPESVLIGPVDFGGDVGGVSCLGSESNPGEGTPPTAGTVSDTPTPGGCVLSDATVPARVWSVTRASEPNERQA